MRNIPDLDQIRDIVHAVAESCATLMEQVILLEAQLDAQGAGFHERNTLENLYASRSVSPEALFEQVIIDASARTVTFRGETCCLGNTLVFRLIERLARRPNQFISFDRLVRDVWGGQAKSDEAIRSLANDLRDRLRRGGMRSLASCIHGQNKAYALMLDR